MRISVYYVAVRTIVLSRHGSNLARPVIIYGLIYVPGGMGVTSAWSPLGNFLEGQAHPNVFRFLPFIEPGYSIFFLREVFCFCFPVFQGFSLRLLCLFSNSFQFKFFIYSYLYILYIFHCTCGALQCSHGL